MKVNFLLEYKYLDRFFFFYTSLLVSVLGEENLLTHNISVCTHAHGCTHKEWGMQKIRKEKINDLQQETKWVMSLNRQYYVYSLCLSDQRRELN